MTSIEEKLTEAERRVLNRLLDGYSNVAIGKYLRLSDKTVKNHLARIMHKTNSRTRLELTVKVYKARIRQIRRART
jgi:two-component system, NarL family, response regulator DegU